jgi:Ca-activated chloride channel homolog
MSFLTPSALLLSALAVPLVVLYMLRTRRHRREVPSVMLWERTGVAVTSAVPWQKPKVTTLLVLQMLALFLFVFLLARPFSREESLLGPHTVFVMDTSGSMAMAGRLDAAKQRALDLINDASAGNVISIVEAGPRPRILAALARDPAELRDVISGLTPGGGLENLDGAIAIANGLATPDRPTRILIFSDGGTPELTPLAEPVIGAEHLLFDATADNLAITAFSGEGSADGKVRLFFEVSNFGSSARDTVVTIAAGSQPDVSIPITVPAGGRIRDGVRVDAESDLTVSASLQEGDGVPIEDGNPLDNTADLVFGEGETRSIAIVGTGSMFLDALVGSVTGFVPAAGDAPDLLIIDREDAGQLTAPSWLLRPTTPPAGITITGIVQNTAASYQRPGEPLLADVDLSSLAIAEADIVEAPGWLPLVKAGDVPLVLLGEADGHRVVYFTFDLTESNLPIQVGFPILGTHVLRYLAGQDLASLVPGPAGQPITLAPPPGSTTLIATPSGATRELPASVGLFEDTAAPGIYRVTYQSETGEVRQGPVAVREFVPAEASGPSRTIATEPLALASVDSTAVIGEWTALILLALLSLLLLEWWVGHGAPRPGRRHPRRESA